MNDSNDLRDASAPHALVIGGTRGIGRACVARLASDGYCVSVIARSAASTMPGGSVRVWQADVSDPVHMASILDQIVNENGSLSNLAFFQRYRGGETEWAGELATSLTATKAVIDWSKNHFVESGPRSITVVGSVAGRHIAPEQGLGYHVAKAGLVQLARYYAVEFGPLGIRVNCVSPGTTMKEESAQYYADNPQVVNRYLKVIPLGRMGTAADIADVVAFLSGPGSGFLTGQEIVIDGGASLVSQESLAQMGELDLE